MRKYVFYLGLVPLCQSNVPASGRGSRSRRPRSQQQPPRAFVVSPRSSVSAGDDMPHASLRREGGGGGKIGKLRFASVQKKLIPESNRTQLVYFPLCRSGTSEAVSTRRVSILGKGFFLLWLGQEKKMCCEPQKWGRPDGVMCVQRPLLGSRKRPPIPRPSYRLTYLRQRLSPGRWNRGWSRGQMVWGGTGKIGGGKGILILAMQDGGDVFLV